MAGDQNSFLLSVTSFILPEWHALSDTKYILAQAVPYNTFWRIAWKYWFQMQKRTVVLFLVCFKNIESLISCTPHSFNKNSKDESLHITVLRIIKFWSLKSISSPVILLLLHVTFKWVYSTRNSYMFVFYMHIWIHVVLSIHTKK